MTAEDPKPLQLGQEAPGNPVVPPSSKILEGAVLAAENGRVFIEQAEMLLDHGGSPGCAVALAVNGLEEIAKGFIWASSAGIKQHAIAGKLREAVRESHVLRMVAGSLLCLIAALLKASRDQQGVEISKAIEALTALDDNEQVSLLNSSNPGEALAQRFATEGVNFEDIFTQQLNALRDRATSAGLGSKDVVSMLKSLRYGSMYVDWDDSREVFTSPQALSPESARSLIDEFKMGAQLAELFSRRMFEAEQSGHLSRIQRTAKRTWWSLEALERGQK